MVPRSDGRPRLPLMCCNRTRPQWTGPLPSSGAPVAGPVWHQRYGARSRGICPRAVLDAIPRPGGMTMEPWNVSPVVDARCRCPLPGAGRPWSSVPPRKTRSFCIWLGLGAGISLTGSASHGGHWFPRHRGPRTPSAARVSCISLRPTYGLYQGYLVRDDPWTISGAIVA